MVSPHSSTIASELANIASVSVGKPAMMSAPKTMSGRTARMSAQKDRIGAQWRRFMRLRIMSSPAAATDADAASAALGGDRLDQIRSSASTESMEDSRSRGRSGTKLQDRRTSLPSFGAARQVGAIAGHVDAGQHHLAVAVADEPPGPGDDGAHRHRARGPRPNGMMQKVQRWSQPFCTCTKARARPSIALDQMARGLASPT
jgi:hypothetical protein